MFMQEPSTLGLAWPIAEVFLKFTSWGDVNHNYTIVLRSQHKPKYKSTTVCPGEPVNPSGLFTEHGCPQRSCTAKSSPSVLSVAA